MYKEFKHKIKKQHIFEILHLYYLNVYNGNTFIYISYLE